LSRVILQPLAEKIAEPDLINNLLLIFFDDETVRIRYDIITG